MVDVLDVRGRASELSTGCIEVVALSELYIILEVKQLGGSEVFETLGELGDSCA
jgi:hypothetical protein